MFYEQVIHSLRDREDPELDVAEVEAIIKTLREQGADNLDVEAKASQTALPKSVRDTLSAFANTTGGTLLLGVAETDNFAVVGVDNPAKIASDLASACAMDVYPPLRPVIKQLEVDGKWVVVAEVERSSPRRSRASLSAKACLKVLTSACTTATNFSPPTKCSCS